MSPSLTIVADLRAHLFGHDWREEDLTMATFMLMPSGLSLVMVLTRAQNHLQRRKEENHLHFRNHNVAQAISGTNKLSRQLE